MQIGTLEKLFGLKPEVVQISMGFEPKRGRVQTVNRSIDSKNTGKTVNGKHFCAVVSRTGLTPEVL
jgi:hypothetical protein